MGAALLFAAFAFIPPLSAAEKKASAPSAAGAEVKTAKKAEAKAKVRSGTGEVVSVDSQAGALTIKARSKEMSFSAESKAAKGALEKVKSGDRVTVSYTEQGGKMVARSVKPAKTKKQTGNKTAKTEMKKEKM
jgi:Cu/Ag efflux protein CusF